MSDTFPVATVQSSGPDNIAGTALGLFLGITTIICTLSSVDETQRRRARAFCNTCVITLGKIRAFASQVFDSDRQSAEIEDIARKAAVFAFSTPPSSEAGDQHETVDKDIQTEAVDFVSVGAEPRAVPLPPPPKTTVTTTTQTFYACDTSSTNTDSINTTSVNTQTRVSTTETAIQAATGLTETHNEGSQTVSYFDIGIQTDEINTPLDNWRRVVRTVRHHSFLRRLRFVLGEYLHTFEALYRK